MDEIIPATEPEDENVVPVPRTDYVEIAGLRTGKDGSLIARDDRYRRLNKGMSHPNDKDQRTPTEKDRGRVQYSSMIRRLAGVTQVISPSLGSSRLHTRESHSQKVALVAREIAADIIRRANADPDAVDAIKANGGLDLTAAEAAGLAHDLGHPPFGHAGEVALNERLRAHDVADGFEGNAQSFRIVTRLERRKADAPEAALDLTAVTLAAILKYPYLCGPDDQKGGKNEEKYRVVPPKFGAYQDDALKFTEVWNLVAPVKTFKGRQTLEASIMDLADDITYAIHDLEDFYRENVIDFSRVEEDLTNAQFHLLDHSLADAPDDSSNAFLIFGRKLEAKYPGFFTKDLYRKKLEDAVTLIRKARLRFKYVGSWDQSTNVTSELAQYIEDMFRSIAVRTEPPWDGGPSVFLEQPEWHLMQVLKTVTRRYVVSTSSMGLMERAQKTLVENLFDSLVQWLETGPRFSELPQPLADYLKDADASEKVEAKGDEAGETAPPASDRVPLPLTSGRFRAIADYICSMSDEECKARSRWLQGVDFPTYSAAR